MPACLVTKTLAAIQDKRCSQKGIIILAALSLQGYRNLHNMNGLKSLLAAILSVLSVVTFMTAGLIAWKVALPMALANFGGAYITAHWVRRLESTDRLRIVIIGVGLIMTVVFFVA